MISCHENRLSQDDGDFALRGYMSLYSASHNLPARPGGPNSRRGLIKAFDVCPGNVEYSAFVDAISNAICYDDGMLPDLDLVEAVVGCLTTAPSTRGNPPRPIWLLQPEVLQALAAIMPAERIRSIFERLGSDETLFAEIWTTPCGAMERLRYCVGPEAIPTSWIRTPLSLDRLDEFWNFHGVDLAHVDDASLRRRKVSDAKLEQCLAKFKRLVIE